MKKFMTPLSALIVLVFCSCSSGESLRLYSAAPSSESFYFDDAQSKSSEQNQDKVEVVDRKIIKQGTIKFQTTDINKTKSLISQTIQELNGYISNENAYDYANRVEHKITIRVPADKFDLLITGISVYVDKFDSRNIDRLDVTEEYIDIEARIKTKKELQGRYRELLKQANKVDEMINIEREIGKLQTEIESIEGKMNYFNDRIAFSTLTVTYYQYYDTASSFGFFSKFIEGLQNGWHGFLVFIIGVSNLWVFIILVAVAIYLFRLRRSRKRNRKKNE